MHLHMSAFVQFFVFIAQKIILRFYSESRVKTVHIGSSLHLILVIDEISVVRKRLENK
jgi:hypothetical protein